MSVRFRDYLLVGSLVAMAGLQACASRSPVVKPAPDKTGNEPPTAAELTVRMDESSPLPVGSKVESSKVESSEVESSLGTVTQPVVAEQPKLPPAVAEPRVERAPEPAPAANGKPRPPQKSQAQEKTGPTVTQEPPAAANPGSVGSPKPAVKPTAQAELPSSPSSQSVTGPADAVAPVSEPASPESVIVEPEVEVTLESLPLTIRDEWVLSTSDDACTLSTSPIRFDDGQGTSKLQLVFTQQHWLIKTQSDIDMSYTGTGLTVDEGTHFPLEQVARQSDLIFTKEYAAITQAFIDGKSLRITLGFWPTWPVTETKDIAVSLQNFASAHRAWKQCLFLINGR